MLTKTQLRIMQVFTSKITQTFSIREVARELHTDYSLIYRALKPLITKHKLLKEGENKRVMLNFREHHSTLAFIEHIRKDTFLSKPHHKDLALCLTTFIKKFKEENCVLLLFGSVIDKKNPRDVDIILIVDETNKTDSAEAFLHNTSRDYALDKKLHIQCISYKSVYEMLSTREQRNIINEALNKHIIIYGAELFYRLLTKGRR